MPDSSFVFRSNEFSSSELGTLESTDLLFIGESVDDRGEAAHGIFRPLSRKVVHLRYQPEIQTLVADGDPVLSRTLSNTISSCKTVRIETTTLGLAEILRVVQAALDAGQSSLEFVYVEPRAYQRVSGAASDGTGLLNHRDFALTTNSKFVGMHGFSQLHDANCVADHVFFLGFESSRLAQALEQRGDPPATSYRRYAVIGVPAFSPGWENHVFASHAALLKRLEFEASCTFFCSANSVRDAYMLLWDIQHRIGDAGTRTLFVSPLGTKPHAVGAALFLAETKGGLTNTALYYDHPQRTHKRSIDVGSVHVCNVLLRGA